jgi:hypothetical protein
VLRNRYRARSKAFLSFFGWPAIQPRSRSAITLSRSSLARPTLSILTICVRAVGKDIQNWRPKKIHSEPKETKQTNEKDAAAEADESDEAGLKSLPLNRISAALKEISKAKKEISKVVTELGWDEKDRQEDEDSRLGDAIKLREVLEAIADSLDVERGPRGGLPSIGVVDHGQWPVKALFGEDPKLIEICNERGITVSGYRDRLGQAVGLLRYVAQQLTKLTWSAGRMLSSP